MEMFQRKSEKAQNVRESMLRFWANIQMKKRQKDKEKFCFSELGLKKVYGLLLSDRSLQVSTSYLLAVSVPEVSCGSGLAFRSCLLVSTTLPGVIRRDGTVTTQQGRVVASISHQLAHACTHTGQPQPSPLGSHFFSTFVLVLLISNQAQVGNTGQVF